MAKIYLFLLLGLLVAACSSKSDEKKQPILVTHVVMPDPGTVFTPGDKVTILAEGFQAGDDIMLDVRWPLPDGPIKEGYARGIRAVITENTGTSITILAPGHYPASTVELLLFRSGEMMSLGKIALKSGEGPKELQLYGITNSYANTNHTYTFIDHIDRATGQVTEVVRLPENEDFSCVVNVPGTWCLCGVWTQDEQRAPGRYDLSMNYWDGMGAGGIVTMGTTTTGGVIRIQSGGGYLYTSTTTPRAYGRSSMPAPRLTYQLPAGMQVQALSRYPCVEDGDDRLFLSADNGDGTFSPVVLYERTGSDNIDVCDPIQAVALIPFWITVAMDGMGPTGQMRVGGYAVAKANGGTELRLWNQATKSLDAPFATFPNVACSVATFMSGDLKKQELYVLFDTNQGGRLIQIYNLLKEEWRSFPNSGFPYSEIILAR